MERKQVSSSNIESIGYDEQKEVLEIEFKGGSVYQYEGVSKSDHQALITAESIGSHFHANIKNSFSFVKV